MEVKCGCGKTMQHAASWDGYECQCGSRRSAKEVLVMGGGPIQEMDGHFRGCARFGKCDCPANAPRGPRPAPEVA